LSSNRIITPEAILSFPHLDKPQKGAAADSKEKYSCALVFAPGTDLAAMKKLALEVATAAFGATYKLPNGTEIPLVEAIKAGIYKWPFRTDAKATTMKGYADGSTVINARSEQQPGVVYAQAGENGKPKPMAVADIKKELYPGAIVRASLAAFAYNRPDSKGVSFALNNLQKLRDGERIDGRVSAENEFEADLSATPADISSLI